MFYGSFIPSYFRIEFAMLFVHKSVHVYSQTAIKYTFKGLILREWKNSR